MLRIYPVDSEVVIGDDIQARITAVCLRGLAGTSVTYECVWWDGRSRRSEWLTESEIKSQENTIVGIGFKE